MCFDNSLEAKAARLRSRTTRSTLPSGVWASPGPCALPADIANHSDSTVRVRIGTTAREAVSDRGLSTTPFTGQAIVLKRSLKIAHLVPYYAPVIGGVEVVCQYISEELVSRGHEVHVFTANRSHSGSPEVHMPNNEVIAGVNVHRFKSYLNVGHYGLFPGFVSPLLKGGFDIIHAHGYRQPQSEIGSRVGVRVSAPTILHVHGGFYTRSRLKRVLYGMYDRAALHQKPISSITSSHCRSKTDGSYWSSMSPPPALASLEMQRRSGFRGDRRDAISEETSPGRKEGYSLPQHLASLQETRAADPCFAETRREESPRCFSCSSDPMGARPRRCAKLARVSVSVSITSGSAR